MRYHQNLYCVQEKKRYKVQSILVLMKFNLKGMKLDSLINYCLQYHQNMYWVCALYYKNKSCSISWGKNGVKATLINLEFRQPSDFCFSNKIAIKLMLWFLQIFSGLKFTSQKLLRASGFHIFFNDFYCWFVLWTCHQEA